MGCLAQCFVSVTLLLTEYYMLGAMAYDCTWQSATPYITAEGCPGHCVSAWSLSPTSGGLWWDNAGNIGLPLVLLWIQHHQQFLLC